jgi:hypothetical protein
LNPFFKKYPDPEKLKRSASSHSPEDYYHHWQYQRRDLRNDEVENVGLSPEFSATVSFSNSRWPSSETSTTTDPSLLASSSLASGIMKLSKV